MNTRFPREMIHWYPMVDSDSCAGDSVCFDFCRNGVFDWDADRSRPIVRNPMKCAVGCDACAKLCPSDAITFPSKDALRLELHRLLGKRREPEGREAGRDRAP